MRNLQTSDVFNALRIISASNMKDEVKRISLMAQSGKGLNIEEVGLEFILGMMDKISGKNVEKEFYKFIGDILEKESSEIEKMNPLDLFDEIKRLSEIIEMDRWRDFFMLVAKLMK